MTEKKLTMKDYVREAPEVLRKNLNHSKELTQSLVNEYVNNNLKDILIIASGSSYNGSLCARSFLRKILQCEVKVVTPFTFVHYENDYKENDLVVVISQSGRSTNALDAIQLVKKNGHRAIGITGDLKSDFSDICDLTIDWGVGIEKVLMVTKGVVTLTQYLMLFGLEAALEEKRIDEKEYESWMKDIDKSIKAYEQLESATTEFITRHNLDILSMHNVWFVSAGSNRATAVEGALKIGEAVKLHASNYEVEEFLHGPVFPINPDYTVFFYDSNDEAGERILQVYRAVKKVTNRAYLITDRDLDDPDTIKTDIHIAEPLNPLAYLAVAPLIADHVSETLNTQIGFPPRRTIKQDVSTKSEKHPRGAEEVQPLIF